MRGVSDFHANRFTNAISDFEKYLKRDTSDNETVGYRGFAYLKDGQIMKASIDLASSGNHQFIDYHKLGRSVDSLLHKGDTVGTLKYLNIITRKAPHFTEGYVSKIRLLVQQDQWFVISKEIDKAISFSRADAGTRPNSYLLTIKAITSSRSENFQEAIEKLNEAIKMDKENSLAFLERGKILLSTRKTVKGINDLRKASSLGRKEADAILNGMNP